MAGTPELSERELEIMREVATGASNREVARALDISPNTVKVHLRNIYEKLGVASRTEATLVVLREGWVEVEGVESTDASTDGAADSGGASEGESVTSAAPGSSEIEPLSQAGAAYVTTVPQHPVRAKAMAGPLSHPVVVTDGRPASRGLPSWMTVLLGASVIALAIVVAALLLRPSPASAPSPVASIEEPARWQQLARLPAPRTAAAVVPLGGDLLLVGGVGETGTTDEVWRYDASQARWTAQTPLPQALQDAATLAVGRSVLVVGGVDAAGDPTDAVYRYDASEDAWAEAVSLPHPLARSALATFEGDVYLFGGWDGIAVQDDIYRYSEDGGTWEAVGALPAPRADLAATTVQDGVVLVGGTDAGGVASSEVFHFDPRAEPSVRTEAPLPEAVARPTLAALGNALYLLGESGLLVRDPEQGWKRIELPEGAVASGAALVADDPYVMLLGGEAAGTPQASVWQYQAIFRSFIPFAPSE